MLVLQTADDLLYVPDREVASIMPAYPDRWRIVLADGRVGHRTGPAPEGPWVPLHNGWVRPEHLTKIGNHWQDPADFRYPFQPLPAPADPAEAESDLPPGLLTLEKRDDAWFYRTDTGELPCDLTREQLRELYPELAELNANQMVYLPRVRRLRTGPPGPVAWLDLDQGDQLKTVARYYFALANKLGLESFVSLDLSVPETLWKLREFPYDLTTADPERISRDMPTELSFLQQLLWQVVTQNERDQPNDYGRDAASFAQNPLLDAARRCGYQPTKKRIYKLLQQMSAEQELFTLRQLGFRELNPDRRLTGSLRPQVVLLAPHAELKAARQAAQDAGISFLATGNSGAIVLEYLAAELAGPLQLLHWKVDASEAKRLRKRFAQLGLETWGSPIHLEDLERLPHTLAQLPRPQSVPQEPFRRIPLEDFNGLYFADPDEIAAWTPSRPSRWRVDLHDGRSFHHPGPPPETPARHQPDPRLWLERRQDHCLWHLDDGSQTRTPLEFPEAAAHHPSLAGLNRDRKFNYNRLRRSRSLDQPKLVLDNGEEFVAPDRLWDRRLREVLGLKSLVELGPDPHGLRFLELRDVPYEIARAGAAQLRADFPGLTQLLANVIWQVHSGQYKYATTFAGFFYRPLQAILYRAGYLTRAQLTRSNAAKDRIYRHFCQLMTRMVRHYRLFNYRELGFRDPFPANRILGDRQPQRILLVEKGDNLPRHALKLQREFGLTVLLLKGMPSLLATEYFCAALREIWQGPVEIYFYGDFDEAGWDIAPSFAAQLLFYGIECTRIERLLLPSIFTPEEQMLYSRPLDPEALHQVTRLERFMRESGGVLGLARGIHANWLQPYPRLRARLAELLT